MKAIGYPLILFSSLLFIISCHRDDEIKDRYYSFPTKNAFWTMAHCQYGFAQKSALVKMGVFGDTIINGKSYHKLFGQSNWRYANSCSDCDFNFDLTKAFYFASFREENKKIFIVPYQAINGDPSGSEYLIYDFNISKVGDVVSVYPYFFNPTGNQANPSPIPGWGGISSSTLVKYTVKEIREVKMSDGTTRTAYLFDDVIVESWIEGIGTSNGFASFNHIYDEANHTLGFSANGVHLLNINELEIAPSGNCGVTPFTCELTIKR